MKYCVMMQSVEIKITRNRVSFICQVRLDAQGFNLLAHRCKWMRSAYLKTNCSDDDCTHCSGRILCSEMSVTRTVPVSCFYHRRQTLPLTTYSGNTSGWEYDTSGSLASLSRGEKVMKHWMEMNENLRNNETILWGGERSVWLAPCRC